MLKPQMCQLELGICNFLFIEKLLKRKLLFRNNPRSFPSFFDICYENKTPMFFLSFPPFLWFCCSSILLFLLLCYFLPLQSFVLFLDFFLIFLILRLGHKGGVGISSNFYETEFCFLLFLLFFVILFSSLV